jgi:hypothetical protein
MTNERTAREILADIIRLSDSLTEDTGTPRAMQVVEMLDKCIEEGRALLASEPNNTPCARCRELVEKELWNKGLLCENWEGVLALANERIAKLEDCLGFGITTVNCLMGGYDDEPIPSIEVSAGQTFIDEAKKLLTKGDTNE